MRLDGYKCISATQGKEIIKLVQICLYIFVILGCKISILNAAHGTNQGMNENMLKNN